MQGILLLFAHIGLGIANIWNQAVNKNLVPALDVAFHAGIGFIGGAILPAVEQYAQNGGVLTLPGLLPIIVGTIIGGLIGAAKHSPNQIISALAANVTTGQMSQATAQIDTKVLNAVQTMQASKASTLTAPKTGLFLLGLLVLSAQAWATNPIGVPLNPPPTGEDAWLVMPFTNVNAYTMNSKTNYGLGLAYGFAFANVLPDTATTSVISPFFYLAPYASVEIANWINAGGAAPLSLDYGVMLGLPQLDSTVPEVGLTLNWNSMNGSFMQGPPVLGIVLAFPTDVLADVLVRKLNL